MNKSQAIEAVYAKIPEFHCRGLCHEACGPIGMQAAERERLEAKVGARVTCGPDLRCSALNAMGHCSGYEARPLICRLFGAVEDMPCPHGCGPKRKLTSAEGRDLLVQIAKLSPYTTFTLG